jgi:hypothetical protein
MPNIGLVKAIALSKRGIPVARQHGATDRRGCRRVDADVSRTMLVVQTLQPYLQDSNVSLRCFYLCRAPAYWLEFVRVLDP